MHVTRLFLIIAALATWTCAPARAASPATTNFTVQITIEEACVINAINTLDFGTHGALTAAVTGTTTLSVQCTAALPYSIGLSIGAGSGATTAIRKMTSAALDTINYSLYKDAGHSQVWGDSGGELVSGVGTGASVPFTIYGRVPAQTTPAAAVYSDTVTITVSW